MAEVLRILKAVCQTDHQRNKVDGIFSRRSEWNRDSDLKIAVYDVVREVFTSDQQSEIENQIYLKLSNMPFDVEAKPTTNPAIKKFVDWVMELFDLQYHVEQTNLHREFLNIVFKKYEEFVQQHPNKMTTEQFGNDRILNLLRILVTHHDTSKYELKMALAYSTGRQQRTKEDHCKTFYMIINPARRHALTEPHHNLFWTSSDKKVIMNNINTWVNNLHFATDKDRKYIRKAIGEYNDRLLSIFVLESVLDQTAQEWRTTNPRLGGMEKLRNCSPEKVFSMVRYKFPLGRTPFANIFRKLVSSLIDKEDNEPVQHLSKRLRECKV